MNKKGFTLIELLTIIIILSLIISIGYIVIGNVISNAREKTYRVTVRPPVTDEMLNALMNGVKLDDGYVTAPAEATIDSTKE